MRLIFECPHCHSKKVEVKDEQPFGEFIFKTLSCGHVITEKKLSAREINDLLVDGRKLYPFQKVGVEFAKANQFRVLIADEMGLGKTIQVASILDNFPELKPALVVCKAGLMVNWMRELAYASGIISQILTSKSEPLTSNGTITIDAYLTSYDGLKGAKWKDKIDFNLLVLDECQMIKNHDSKRTQETRNLARGKRHIIATSASPIYNNAGEYFPILNILDPYKFGNRTSFINYETNSYWDGYRYKVGGLRNPEGFKEKTKNLIIRRTIKEVGLDLPEFRKSYRYMTMIDEAQKQYNKEVDNLTEYMDDEGDENVDNILAYMNKMRHIVGLAKTTDIAEYVEEWLESSDDEAKLTVFHHHKDVGLLLVRLLQSLLDEREKEEKVIQLTSEHDPIKERPEIEDKFREDPKVRILVAPTLACGEGLNFQFCHTAVLGEREWNPPRENQAAPGRFRRIGSKAEFIDVVMPVAINSIDELFAEYVARKEQYFNETMEGKRVPPEERWNQTQIIKEIANKIVSENRKSWRQKVGI